MGKQDGERGNASSSLRSRGRPKSIQAHQAIIDATLVLVAQLGIAGTSMDAIAEKAGVSKATMYNHWHSKEQLCLEAIRSLRSDTPIADSGNARADVLTLLQRLLRESVSSTSAVLARMVGEGTDFPEIASMWRTNIMAPRRMRLKDILQRGIMQGQLCSDLDLDLAADLLLGPIFYRRLVTGDPTPPEQLAEQLVMVVWTAFAPPS